MTSVLLLTMLTMLGGCGERPQATDGRNPDDEADADTDVDADSDSDSDGDSDSDIDDLDEDLCEDVAGYEDLIGATSYYKGDFRQSGDSWSGTERWLLFATSEWEEVGGGDCQVTWVIEGTTTTEVGECAVCEFGIDLAAQVDLGNTDCDPDLYKGDESFTITYAVDDHGDGTHALYFAGSGNPLATGTLDGDGLEYLSDAKCLWF